LKLQLDGRDSSFIIDEPAATLLSLSTCRDLEIVPHSVSKTSNQEVPKLLEQYNEVFQGLGTYRITVSLKLKWNAVTKALPTNHIPSGVRDKLRQDLQSLEEQHIICKNNEPAKWLTSIAIVNKPDGRLRICLNPQHLNSQLTQSQFMRPTTGEIFSRNFQSRGSTKSHSMSNFASSSGFLRHITNSVTKGCLWVLVWLPKYGRCFEPNFWDR